MRRNAVMRLRLWESALDRQRPFHPRALAAQHLHRLLKIRFSVLDFIIKSNTRNSTPHHRHLQTDNLFLRSGGTLCDACFDAAEIRARKLVLLCRAIVVSRIPSVNEDSESHDRPAIRSWGISACDVTPKSDLGSLFQAGRIFPSLRVASSLRHPSSGQERRTP